MDGFERYKNREGIACGIHIENSTTPGWNTELVEGYLKHSPSVLMHWAKRERGLIVRPDSHIQRLADLQGKRFVSRQAGAAAQLLFETHLSRAQVDLHSIHSVRTARTETDAALSIVEGEADVTFGLPGRIFIESRWRPRTRWPEVTFGLAGRIFIETGRRSRTPRPDVTFGRCGRGFIKV